MKPRALLIAAGLAAAFVVRAALPAEGAARAIIGGRYLVNGEAGRVVVISVLANDVCQLVGDDWEGVGLFDGASYWGVFQHRGGAGADSLTGARGTHRATLGPNGSLVVHGEYTLGRTGSFQVVWMPERSGNPRVPGLPVPHFEHPVWPPDAPPGTPQFGEYVYVEELPEAVTKVPPEYPPAARDAKIEGTVLLQALVGKDGRVSDTKIVKSIPGLDEAAAACVRQWVFKPARAKGEPVAVWVAVPVRFSLQ
jgi:TonB family protein